ncbi:hypothetical protein PV04_05534 [Phialophora macrospora]|uniref:Uncharacterized protein n=1 Tax=Phialophora macrospora TaxID=1851006 RepID=A0A0D2CWW8_9EURO|nr:hypothetical protein PV04_05534 [Phialophora macrospora]
MVKTRGNTRKEEKGEKRARRTIHPASDAFMNDNPYSGDDGTPERPAYTQPGPADYTQPESNVRGGGDEDAVNDTEPGTSGASDASARRKRRLGELVSHEIERVEKESDPKTSKKPTTKRARRDEIGSPTAAEINQAAIRRLGPPGIKSPKAATKRGKTPIYPEPMNDDLVKIFGGQDLEQSINNIVKDAEQNPQGNPSSGTRSKITIKLKVRNASAAKKEEDAAAAAAKKKTAEAADAKKRAKEEAAAAKKKERENAAAAKKQAKQEAAANKKKEKEDAAAAKKRAREDAAAGKASATKQAAKAKVPKKSATSTRKTRSRKEKAEPARLSPVPASPKRKTTKRSDQKNQPKKKEPAKGKPTKKEPAKDKPTKKKEPAKDKPTKKKEPAKDKLTKKTQPKKTPTTASRASKKAATAKKQAGQGKAPAKEAAKPKGVTKTRSTRSSARAPPTKADRQPSCEKKEQARILSKGDRKMITFAARSRKWFSQLERTYGPEFMKVVLNEKGILHVDFWNRGLRFLAATGDE